MKPKIRKIDTNARKRRRKEAMKELEAKAAAFLDHPTECCVCHAIFERNKETVKSWHVTVDEDRVRLTCPGCWGTVTALVERFKK